MPTRSFSTPILHWAILCLALAAGTAAADPLLADIIQAGDRTTALKMLSAGADVNTPPAGRHDASALGGLSERRRTGQNAPGARSEAGCGKFPGLAPLTEAVKAGNLEIVGLLLKAGANVEAANSDGQTALMLAARNGSSAIAQRLLRRGANVNAREKWRGQTALMWAAAERYPDVVELLLAHHAAVNVRASFTDWGNQITSEPRAQYRPTGGMTPLIYAARADCQRCAQALLKAGADVNMPNPDGVTALMTAIDNLHFDLAKFLLERGANPHVWDWWGPYAALHRGRHAFLSEFPASLSAVRA